MADPRHARGRAAEDAVARWLAGHGWRILATRYRVPAGEVDIVALDRGSTLVGVEVRLRRTSRRGDPLASLDRRHLSRVGAALVTFARRSGVAHRDLRLDLVAVQPGPEAGTWRLHRVPGVDAW